MPVTPEAMAALRLRGDELADATVEALFAAGEIGHFNTLMRWFERSGDPLPEGLPQAAHDYLAATSTPPDWVDWDRMETARMFFIDNIGECPFFLPANCAGARSSLRRGR